MNNLTKLAFMLANMKESKEMKKKANELNHKFNSPQGAKLVFGEGRGASKFTYQGAPIKADFELTYENLAPFVTKVLDLAAEIEATGHHVNLVKIINGKVELS